MAEKLVGKNVKKKKKLTKKQQQKRKLTIVGVEILCLILVLILVFVWSIVGKITFKDLLNAGINDDLSAETLDTLSNYTNIAVFGLDNRSSGNYASGNSDVIMIVSINNETKEVKLVSVYRDTYLCTGDGKYGKANSAFSKGGAEQAVQMLNANLDLNIGEYVCVDWAAVIEVIDALGGVEIELTSAEVANINGSIVEINNSLGTNSKQITKSGLQHLDGVQATAYARIRHTAGDDFKRTSRQRIVIGAMLEKAKEADASTLINICNLVFDDIETSLDLATILELVTYVPDVELTSTSGFPFDLTTKVLSGGDSVVPVTLETNVSALHEYLFGTVDYEPSNSVQTISDTIIEKTGVTEGTSTVDTSGYNDTVGQDGTDFD